MRFMLVGATATMALLGATVLATAQAQDDRSKGPAAEGKGRASDGPASDGKGTQREPQAGQSERSKQPAPGTTPRAERRDDKSGPGAERSQGTDRPKATQQQQQDRPKSTQQQQQDRDRSKATQQQQQDRDRSKATQQQQQGQQQQGKDQPKATEQQRKDGPPRTTEGARPGKDQADGKGDRRVKVGEPERRSAGQRIRQTRVDRVQRSRININVNVGRAIPRSVRLYALPVGIFDIAPDYRDYSYVLLDDDTILIVDARTYVIVDVIPAGSERADRPGRYLALSAEQMRFVFANVPRNATADVRVRLALGAEVPRDVELMVFPGDVTGQIGELGQYRYIVAGGDVVVVDPDDHAVVLVISE